MIISKVLLLTGCGTSPQDRALSGAAIGGGAGLVGGALIGMPAVGGAIGAAAGAGLGVAIPRTDPSASAPPAASDHFVTSYVVKPHDLAKARRENFRQAGIACGGGIVMIDEQGGADANGGWLRLVYGCLAKDVAVGDKLAAPAR